MAVEKRFITEKQLIECLNTIEFFERDKTLDQVFLEKGYLTQTQVDRLNGMLDDEMGGPDENVQKAKRKMFGELALEQNMINDEQMMDALDIQEQFLERGIRVQMGQVLVKNQSLTAAQLKRVLDAQSRKVLDCPRCKDSKTIHNYNPGQIYQCENLIDGSFCGFDLTEMKKKKKKKSTTKKQIQKIDPLDELDDLDEVDNLLDPEDDGGDGDGFGGIDDLVEIKL